ncbi:MAG TPA: hypothetical protein VGF99_11310 [Myxococcota bacterium]
MTASPRAPEEPSSSSTALSSSFPASSIPLETQQALREFASERIDDATHSLFACALLFVTAGAVALSATTGPGWLTWLAIAMAFVAVVVVAVVRHRLRRGLVRFGVELGLTVDDARRETDGLLRRALQPD